MGIVLGNEHWSGPENMAQGNTDGLPSQEQQGDEAITVQDILTALQNLSNNAKGKPSTDEAAQHWSGPDDLLSR